MEIGFMQFAPVLGKYKIYIIDEVHMLTQEAFNALLKTLEEPPQHVKFIFATTRPDKILATILSRCQRFEFSRIPSLKIIAKLEEIAKHEKISIDKEVFFNIAKIFLFEQAIQSLQRDPAITHNGNGHKDVLPNGSGINVNVNNFSLWCKDIGLACDTVVKSDTNGNEKVAFCGREIGTICTMHANHAEPEGILGREAPEAHQTGRYRSMNLFYQFF